MHNATAADRPLRIAQISDCHLGAETDFCLAGVRPYRSFHEVLDRLRLEASNIDHILVTGDIAAKGVAPAYQLFSLGMRSLGLPYNWLPGNHDEFALMEHHSQLPDFEPVVAVGAWRLLCLNTAVPGQVGGYLDEQQLMEIEAMLEACADHPVALFMHHPPTAVGCRWLDRQQVANGDALAAVVRRHRAVKALFCGHVHQASQVEFAGLPLYSSPSTCFQFAPGSDEFALATDPPAFRWIHLHVDGRVTTGITAIEDTQEQVDQTIVGY